MSISAVGSAASYAPHIHAQTAAPARAIAAAPAKVGSDADGDNDGTKGGTVDVRA